MLIAEIQNNIVWLTIRQIFAQLIEFNSKMFRTHTTAISKD